MASSVAYVLDVLCRRKVNSSGESLQRWGVPARSVLLSAALAFFTLTMPRANAQEPPEPPDEVPAAVELPAAAELPDPGPVLFVKDVQPIFAQHCYECHGPQKQESGLRFDDRESLARGGDSGISVLGTPLAESELYRRLTTSNLRDRMPLGGHELPANELAIIRRWIKDGAVWTAPPPKTPADEELSLWQSFIASYESVITPASQIIIRMYGLMSVGMVAMVLVLILERARVLKERDHRWSQGRLKRFFGFAARLSRLWYVIALVSFIAAGFWLYARMMREEVAALQAQWMAQQRMKQQGMAKLDPVRPNHPPRLGGAYYRGNDERNPALFNRGAYRTCTFNVFLCGADHKPLAYGDSIVDQDLFVHFEIIRAKYASAALFSEPIMGKVRLSQQRVNGVLGGKPDRPEPLETLEAGEHWQAYYPLGRAVANGKPLEGTIYLYHDTSFKPADPQQLEYGDPQYGITYKIILEDGKIAPSSEVWMGHIFATANVHVPSENEVPVNEWFGFQPIPEIEEDPAITDPDLLGITEHIEKGDIDKPESAEPKPEATKPKQPAEPKADSAEPKADSAGPKADSAEPKPE